MTGSPILIVVYQFGKVASTSAVAWFNEAEGVEAHQCHYLGADACRKMLERSLDPTVSPYFFDHNVGQLGQVIRVVRRMERIERGLDPGRSVIVSMSRAPLDWFRSAVVQDIVGYLDLLNALSDQDTGDASLGPRAKVRAGLTGFLTRLCDAIETAGGMNSFLSHIETSDLNPFVTLDFWKIPGGTQMFFTATRPLLWFKMLFQPATGEWLENFERREGFWSLSREKRDLYLLRYEDMPEATLKIACDIGLSLSNTLPKINLSAKKPFAEDIAGVFDRPEGQRLGAFMQDTDYARFFNYVEVPNTKA